MTLKIAIDHPTFSLQTKIQEACKPLFDCFGFNYFQYMRCYADGSISGLVNNAGLFECLQHYENEPVIFSSFEDNHEKAHSYWFLWDEELPDTPVQLAREKFNFHHGLTLVRRNKDYYDMIAVALPYEHPNPGSFYLNKLPAIKQFIYQFDLEHKESVDLMDKNKIKLPVVNRDINYKEICLHEGKISVQGKAGEAYITVQEMACLRILLQGASYKHTAKLLEISSRTVETYIARVKQRTGYTTWMEIERMMYLSTIY